MQTTLNKNWLPEIDIIRSIIIIMLVLYHSFAPYTFGWDAIPSIDPHNKIYYWIGKFANSGMLETFVLISGYIFASKSRATISRNTFILKKIKRLYIPTILWGVILILIFNYSDLSNFVTINTGIKLLNGIEHLWFLPMLFWCFVFELYLYPKICDKYLLLFAYLCLIPYPAIPIIRISLYYYLFFHLGVLFFNNKEKIRCWWTTKKFVLLSIVYIILFIAGTVAIDSKYLYFDDTTPIIKKAILIHAGNILRFSYSILATLIYYYIGTHIQAKGSSLYNIIHSIAIYSFGIYILQEIILRLIYYRTDIPLYCHSYMIPWLGFIIAFSCSYFLSYILNKNKITRLLFG